MAANAGRKKATVPPTPAVSTAAEFKARAAGELVELPSGLTVRLRRPRAFSMMVKDQIPNPMLKLVSTELGIGDAETDEEVTDSDQASFVLWIASRTFVEPRLFWPDPEKPDEEAPDDWITVDDLEDGDLLYVFSWSQQIDVARLEEALGDMGPFPDGRPRAADGGDVEGVRPEAEQPA